MATLLLRFPAGRYHATPSGHHVNEGLVEWPPSPWRLLRALLACGYATQRWDEVPASGRRLIESLAMVLPRYRLPRASLAHSRHFMPTAVLDKGREKTTLVLDSWAHVGGGQIAVHWPCPLDPEAMALFRILAAHLGYLGRSESWVDGEVVGDDPAPADGFDAYPHEAGHHPGRGWEQVSLLASEDPVSYAEWRRRAVAGALEEYPLPPGNKKPPAKLLKARARAEDPFPVDVLDCLQRDTSWWKAQRWAQPPGARRVLYWRPAACLEVAPPVRSGRRPPDRVTTILLALSTPSRSRSALPPRTRTLPQAELIHRSLIARCGRGNPVDCPELTGRDAEGQPLRDHRHAHVLPVDLDGDGNLDHALIHASMGLGAAAQEAARGLKRTWTKGGVGELQLALAGQGNLDDLRSLASPLDRGIASLLGPVGGAMIWISSTPLVLPRYLKRRGTNSLEGQILSELASRGLPSARVELMPWSPESSWVRHAVLIRRHPARPPPSSVGLSVRLVFEQPVTGPISLGYASHFGLGLLVADPSA